MSNNLNLIKDLREKTGAGFLDCKQALNETNENIEQAVDFLRKKGLAKASKKSSREAKEGAIGIYFNNKLSVLIKVNSETDFAAKSDVFLNFIDFLGKAALDVNSINLNKEKFLNTEYKNKLIAEHFNDMISKIGENIILNDIIFMDNNKNNFNYYVHNSYRKNIGKIISFLQYSSNKNDDEIIKLSKNICMHIAALKPEAIDSDSLDQKVIDREINIQKELISSSGKPANVIEKILEGKMKKFFSEVTLMNQKYIIVPEKTIKEVIESYSNDRSFELISFKLMILN